MLRLFKSFQPAMAIAIAISSVSMGGSGQANPLTANSEGSIMPAVPLVANSSPPIRRYGSGHVAIDTKIETVSGDAEVALVEHLVKIGAVFYGAHWCSHCQKQKALFGATAATKLPYVECGKDGKNSQRELCRQKNIQMFPTWVINGQVLPGTRELKDIAKATGYTGSMNFKYRK